MGFYLFLRKARRSTLFRLLSFKFEWAAESPRGLVKTQIAVSHLQYV